VPRHLSTYCPSLHRYPPAHPAGRAVFATADGAFLLAVVAKDLRLASLERCQQLRREAPAEAEAYAARLERELLAAGTPLTACGSAFTVSSGKLEFVYWSVPSTPGVLPVSLHGCTPATVAPMPLHNVLLTVSDTLSPDLPPPPPPLPTPLQPLPRGS
jgi:hypothetical protein